MLFEYLLTTVHPHPTLQQRFHSVNGTASMPDRDGLALANWIDRHRRPQTHRLPSGFLSDGDLVWGDEIDPPAHLPTHAEAIAVTHVVDYLRRADGHLVGCQVLATAESRISDSIKPVTEAMRQEPLTVRCDAQDTAGHRTARGR